MMSDEWKPCPFCGGTATTSWYGNKVDIHCDNESCPAMNVDIGDLPYSDAVKAWNTRPIEDAKDAEIARLKEIIRKAEWLWYRQDYPVPDTFQACQIFHNDYLLGHATDCPFYKWEG